MNTTENPNNTTTTTQPSISTIAIKLPQIWEKNVASWFVIVESQFINSRITNDNTKYHHIIASLNESIVSKCIHIITNSPSEGKYDYLKQNLIRLLELSPREKARELLNMNGLGDRKPTELLNSMRRLNDGQQQTELFKELFLEQLPISTRQIIAGLANDLSLDTLAERADSMIKFDSVNIRRE